MGPRAAVSSVNLTFSREKRTRVKELLGPGDPPGAGRCCGVLAQLMVARETSKTDHNMRYLHLEAAGSSPRRGRTMIGRGCWVVSPGVGVELV